MTLPEPVASAIGLAEPRLHHVGIVVPSETDALEQMALLGLVEDFRGTVELWSALCIFTRGNGATPIEYVVPDGGPLARFNKGAGGLHHVAFAVPNLDAVAAALAARGMRLIEREHVPGAGPFRCNFLSPVFTRGLTVEFVEPLDPAGTA